MSDTPDLFAPAAGPSPVYGCIEGGGTKFVLAVMAGPDDTRATLRLPTTTPDETLAAAVAFFEENAPAEGYAGFGIGSFGPVALDTLAPGWGRITDTPKPGWRGTDMVGPFRRFDCPIGFDTDVNAAALAEARWGAAIDQEIAVYVTVGTGIGGGAVVAGRTVRGTRHPEMGHVRPARLAGDDFPGVCPYHGGCLEGLTAGPAIIGRWGAPLSELAPDHRAHELAAHYLGQLVVAIQAMYAPGRIVLGGGVMQTPGLLGRVREAAAVLGNGYFAAAADYEALVVPPALGTRSGIVGALALAIDAR